jgi:hypothetical protein
VKVEAKRAERDAARQTVDLAPIRAMFETARSNGYRFPTSVLRNDPKNNTENNRQELAQIIQDAIEDFLISLQQGKKKT